MIELRKLLNNLPGDGLIWILMISYISVIAGLGFAISINSAWMQETPSGFAIGSVTTVEGGMVLLTLVTGMAMILYALLIIHVDVFDR